MPDSDSNLPITVVGPENFRWIGPWNGWFYHLVHMPCERGETHDQQFDVPPDVERAQPCGCKAAFIYRGTHPNDVASDPSYEMRFHCGVCREPVTMIKRLGLVIGQGAGKSDGLERREGSCSLILAATTE